MPIIQTNKPLRERDDYDHYPTDEDLCRAILINYSFALPTHRPPWIIDPGAGTGTWGAAARKIWPNAIITGTEVRDIPRPPAYDYWYHGHHMTIPEVNGTNYDLVMGNPPYGDLWDLQQSKLKKQAKKEGKEYRKPPRPADNPRADAEAFVRWAFGHIHPYGYIVYLLRLAFLEGGERGRGIWSERKLSNVDVLSSRPSFTGNGKTDSTAYASFMWKGVDDYKPRVPSFEGGWILWTKKGKQPPAPL